MTVWEMGLAVALTLIFIAQVCAKSCSVPGAVPGDSGTALSKTVG